MQARNFWECLGMQRCRVQPSRSSCWRLIWRRNIGNSIVKATGEQKAGSPLSSPYFRFGKLPGAYVWLPLAIGGSALVSLPDSWVSDSTAQRRRQLGEGTVNFAEGIRDFSRATFFAFESTAVLGGCLFKLWDSTREACQFSWAARVARLLADLATPEQNRVQVTVSGGGATLQWLLRQLAGSHPEAQIEAGRAMAHLMSHPDSSLLVLQSDGALQSLLRYAMSQCERGEEQESAADPLLNALMELLTSSAPLATFSCLSPAPRDMEAALSLLRNGTLSLDSSSHRSPPLVSAATEPGLLATELSGGGSIWADLPGKTVATLLASWAVAIWSEQGGTTASQIANLDSTGEAILEGLLAPERSVRRHLACAVGSLLRTNEVSHKGWGQMAGELWSRPLLETAVTAGDHEDYELATAVVRAAASCVRASQAALAFWAEEGLQPLRRLVEADPGGERNADMAPAVAEVLSAVATGGALSAEEGALWLPLLLGWVCSPTDPSMQSHGVEVLERLVGALGAEGLSVIQAWLAALLMAVVTETSTKGRQAIASAPLTGPSSKKEAMVGQTVARAAVAAAQLARLVAQEAQLAAGPGGGEKEKEEAEWHAPVAAYLLEMGGVQPLPPPSRGKPPPRLSPQYTLATTCRALKALTELAADSPQRQKRILDAGGVCLAKQVILLRRLDPSASAPLRKHALRLLKLLITHQGAPWAVTADARFLAWLEACAGGGSDDNKSRSYARETLLMLHGKGPRYEDGVFLLDPAHVPPQPVMDVVFVHGLCGGPFKTWRVADDSEEEGSRCWPESYLQTDLPSARTLTIKYKTNLSEWKAATLPIEELSSVLLEKLWAAGVGQRPTVFVCHSMGGLLVKEMLLLAHKDERYKGVAHNAAGVIFYSCPHSGSFLADLPWRMGLVLRPAPSVGGLVRHSPRLQELNSHLRHMFFLKGTRILSFAETLVTPVVKAAAIQLRCEVVPIESAWPGFGDIVVLEGVDHVNSCKPRNRDDVIYQRTLDVLLDVERKAKERRGERG